MNFRFTNFIIVILLLSTHVLEYGLSTCYFCQWELMSVCDCASIVNNEHSSCCGEHLSDANSGCHTNELVFEQSQVQNISTNKRKCLSCVSVLPKNTYTHQEWNSGNIFEQRLLLVQTTSKSPLTIQQNLTLDSLPSFIILRI